MKIQEIREVIKKYFNDNNIKLYEVSYDSKDRVLTVLLDDKFTIDEIETISNKLSEYLDDYENLFDNNYILDVSTVGVERPIKSKNELDEAIGSYIYVKTKSEEYNGTLLKVDEFIELEVKDKTRVKLVRINYKDIEIMHYAVKF